MKTVNMHEAKTHLSKLVAKAVAGEPFVIARAGKPLVKVTPVEEETKKPLSRLGFMADQEHNWTINPDAAIGLYVAFPHPDQPEKSKWQNDSAH